MEAQSYASGGPSAPECLLRGNGLGIPDREMGRIPGSHHRDRPKATKFAIGIAAGGNTGVGIRERCQLGPRRPEEPDVRPTSPVLWELGAGNRPWLPDMITDLSTGRSEA